MRISGLTIIEDFFYEDYLKVRHTIKLSEDQRSISVINKKHSVILVNSKIFTPLVESIYNELSLELLFNESMSNAPVFFSTFLIKKYGHMFDKHYAYSDYIF